MLVTDDGGRLVGIVTDRDLRHSAFLPFLANHLAWEERWLRTPRVRDIMTSSVVTIDPDADLVRAGLLMFERRIGSLPVTEHGTLVGIVTDRDVFDAFRRDGESPDPGRALLRLIRFVWPAVTRPVAAASQRPHAEAATPFQITPIRAPRT